MALLFNFTEETMIPSGNVVTEVLLDGGPRVGQQTFNTASADSQTLEEE